MAEGNGNGLRLWTSIGVSAVVLFSAVGAFFYVGFQTRTNADDISKNESRIAALESKLALLQDRLTKIEVSENEIETQFCEEGNLRNLMHANDQRNYAVVYEKLFPGALWHTDNAFYPITCNRTSH